MCFGVVFVLVYYFLYFVVEFAAIGLAAILIGVVLMLMPSEVMPSEPIKALLEGAVANIECILEEIAPQGKAVYCFIKDKVYAFVPVTINPVSADIIEAIKMPLRLIMNVEGSDLLAIIPPAPFREFPAEGDAESLLDSIIVNLMELADAVYLKKEGDYFVVRAIKPRFIGDYPRFTYSFGSLISCIAGTILAWCYKTVVQFEHETRLEKELVAVYRVIEHE